MRGGRALSITKKTYNLIYLLENHIDSGNVENNFKGIFFTQLTEVR